MALWDGLDSGQHLNVVVLGATNRLDSLDDAVLRRFTTQIEVSPVIDASLDCPESSRARQQ